MTYVICSSSKRHSLEDARFWNGEVEREYLKRRADAQRPNSEPWEDGFLRHANFCEDEHKAKQYLTIPRREVAKIRHEYILSSYQGIFACSIQWYVVAKIDGENWYIADEYSEELTDQKDKKHLFDGYPSNVIKHLRALKYDVTVWYTLKIVY